VIRATSWRCPGSPQRTGTAQKEIRVTVAWFPYLDLERNDAIDTATIPTLPG
jgi:hypothetical protein